MRVKKPETPPEPNVPALYATLLADIKQRVRRAQVRAMLAVNAELIRLYWDIGRVIDERQQQEGWGAGVIPRLARDLHNDLPEEKGFSERNIKQMLAFYREYAQLSFVQQPAAQIETGPKVPQAAALFTAELILALPWTHHAILMAKVKDPATRHWYMQAALEHGWSRSILVMQIETAAHQRQGRAASNFALRLPKPESDLVQQTLKDPYVVIELKRGEFKPEYAGKMNFYCSVVDDRLRHAHDQPTMGLILCQQHNRVLAEYALRGVEKPIGVSSFELTRALPATLESSLPSIEQIEQELGGIAE
ncbi:PDDEXK nuclease domain-containing protein [Diaphorobacter limosus]|uniref:PDDEXK nuclease domain-containing protein n=1 Tax=Diaphorobacter limosus TaxID=3036128 RepID=A0ABZ0J3I8_9BURK|nr:PDDEXK nuclease domain-containing protein [Diaphorobacter sp. Y-1]WOO32244.1 PDDEXK nuclease domain-containing protein [Diaphorobacter sp. Y-1]